MKFLKLSEVAPSSSSRTKSAPNEIVWHLTLDQIESGSGRIDRRVYGRAAEAASSSFAFDNGNVLYSKLRPYLNKVICPDTSGVATTELVPLRPNPNELNREYLRFYLRSSEFVSWASAQVDGAKMPRMKMKAFWAHEIPILPLDDQLRVAQLLGLVEGLIAQRRQHLQQLDDLLKSVFLELFGFRDGSFAQWPVERLSKYTEVVSGVTKGKKYAAEELLEVPYMRVANVQDGHFVLNEVKTIAVTQKEITQYQLRRGDLLLTEGGDPDKLGRGSVWDEQVPKCIHQNHIFRVRINEQAPIDPHYLSALVGSHYGKSYFLKSAKQTTGIASINSTQLKSFPTVVPPPYLQEKFSTITGMVVSIKSRYLKSLADLEALYGTLSQQAFKGKLDVSRVPIPVDLTRPVAVDASVSLAEAIKPKEQVRPLVRSAEPQGRDQLLSQWLRTYLKSSPPATGLRSAQMLESAWLALQAVKLEVETKGEEGVEEEEEEESPVLSLADYDLLKDLIFKALEDEELFQTFDNDHNQVALTKSRPTGALGRP